MASADFLVSTKRHDSAALLGYDVCKYIRCIIAGMTVFVKCPAIRKRLAHLIIHFQFTSGYNCCRTVKEKRVRVCRHSNCDRVGTQHSLSSEVGTMIASELVHAIPRSPSWQAMFA